MENKKYWITKSELFKRINIAWDNITDVLAVITSAAIVGLCIFSFVIVMMLPFILLG